MDNRRIFVVSEGKKNFELAMELAWPGASGGYASGFAERDKAVKLPDSAPGNWEHGFDVTGKYVVLFWVKSDNPPKDYQSFLGGRAKLKTVVDYLWGWLDEQERPDVDIDGSVGKAFIVFNEAWGHVDEDPYAFVAVAPAVAMYGK